MPHVHTQSSHQYNPQQQPEKLIFYASRLYPVVNALSLFLMFLLFLGLSIGTIIITFPKENANNTGPLFFCLLLSSFIGWCTWNAITQIQVPRPLLLINDLGIFVYKFPQIDFLDRNRLLMGYNSTSDPPRASLLWKDIAYIAARGPLTILPKNVVPQGKRYFRTKSFTVRTGAPISLPQRYSRCSFEEILGQIHSAYGNKLKRHQIEMER